MSTPAKSSLLTGPRRNVIIAGGVLVLHVLVLWAMQTGLLRRAVEIVVPASVLSEIIEPPRPRVEPPPAPPPPPVKRPVVPAPTAAAPAPQPVAIADPTPAPRAPTGVVAPPAPLPPITAPVVNAPPAPPAPAPAPAPPKIELPSSDAAHLQNSLVYPPLSKRRGEQGRVVVYALIGTDGRAKEARVTRSSGFERLDQAALNAVLRDWRFVPGKRGGVPEAMWFNVPINFVLE